MNQQEFRTLVEMLQPLIYGDVETRSKLLDAGISVTRSDFYSEIPTVKEIYGAKKGPDLTRIFPPNSDLLDFLSDLKTYAHEFTPVIDSKIESEFFWNNSQFSYSDALAYYCIIRHTKPKLVLEIGGGYSTIVAKMAIDKNESGILRVIEPYPRDFLRDLAGIELLVTPFQEIDAETLAASLNTGDIVFIDSTHSIKYGSEVLNIYLDFLHLIQNYCYVHVHDVFLPGSIPIENMINHQVYWGEQYLLYAYLLNNSRTKVLFGSRYHVMNNSQVLADFMGGKFQSGGASFWFSQSPPDTK